MKVIYNPSSPDQKSVLRTPSNLCTTLTLICKLNCQSVWQVVATTMYNLKHDPPVRQTLPPGDLEPVGGFQKWSVQLALTYHFLGGLIKLTSAAAC